MVPPPLPPRFWNYIVSSYLSADDYCSFVGSCRAFRAVQELDSPFQDVPTVRRFLHHVHHGDHVFLTGPAGTGKSTVLYELLNSLSKEESERTGWFAHTGIAAIEVVGRGMTLASQFPFAMLSDWKMINDKVNYVPRGKRQKFRAKVDKKNFNKYSRLVIDEAGMVSADMLNRLDAVARMLTPAPQCMRPMGGRQVVFVGDLLQVRPVKGQFIFRSHVWREMRPVHLCLKRSWRHRNDQFFNRFMQRMRVGQVLDLDWNLLLTLARKNPVPGATHVFYKNASVNRHNKGVYKSPVAKAKADEFFVQKSFTAKHEHMVRVPGCRSLVKALKKQLKENPSFSARCLAEIPLLDNGIYTLTKNLDVANGLGNGTILRYLHDLSDPAHDRFVFKFEHNGETKQAVLHAIPQYLFLGSTKSGKTVLHEMFCRRQVPILPAAASTVHRCQGRTIDNGMHVELVELDDMAGKKRNIDGVAYVAFSRATGRDKLSAGRLPKRQCIRADPAALQYYASQGL